MGQAANNRNNRENRLMALLAGITWPKLEKIHTDSQL